MVKKDINSEKITGVNMALQTSWHRLKNIFSLSIYLAKANFKSRNEGSFLGILWYLLEPLLMFFILLTIRSQIKLNETLHYPIYLLLGLVMFNFFMKDTVKATRVITNNSGLIKSVKMPPEALIAANTLESIFAHIFEVVILGALMVIYGVPIVGIIFYPIIFLFLASFVFGLSLILSTIGAYVSDVQNVWNVVTRLLWFGTPIFYAVKPGTKIFFIEAFNPMFYFISVAREIIIYGKLPAIPMIIIGIVISLSFLLTGIIVFERHKNKFAEVA